MNQSWLPLRAEVSAACDVANTADQQPLSQTRHVEEAFEPWTPDFAESVPAKLIFRHPQAPLKRRPQDPFAAHAPRWAKVH